APYLLQKGRRGYRLGNGELVDSMILDGLWDVYNQVHMGTCGDRCAEQYAFSRGAQDDYAVASFRRALEATRTGIFEREIEPVEVGSGREAIRITADENLKKFDEERLRKLKPAFSERGTITAGNASSINDGAAAVVVISGEQAKALGVRPQAKVLGY